MKPITTLFLLQLFLSLACSTSQAALEAVPTPSAVPPSPSPSASPTRLPAKTICAEHLNFRSEPGIQAPIFAVLKQNQQVTLTGQRETTDDGATWVEAQANGQTGWLNLNYLCER
jgi:uncharacterized protein YgiM (DUF1202 family)